MWERVCRGSSSLIPFPIHPCVCVCACVYDVLPPACQYCVNSRHTISRSLNLHKVIGLHQPGCSLKPTNQSKELRTGTKSRVTESSSSSIRILVRKENAPIQLMEAAMTRQGERRRNIRRRTELAHHEEGGIHDSPGGRNDLAASSVQRLLSYDRVQNLKLHVTNGCSETHTEQRHHVTIISHHLLFLMTYLGFFFFGNVPSCLRAWDLFKMLKIC